MDFSPQFYDLFNMYAKRNCTINITHCGGNKRP